MTGFLVPGIRIHVLRLEAKAIEIGGSLGSAVVGGQYDQRSIVADRGVHEAQQFR